MQDIYLPYIHWAVGLCYTKPSLSYKTLTLSSKIKYNGRENKNEK